MKIIERISLAQKLLKETNGEFGKRFGVSDDTVRAWKENRPAPYHVIEFCEMVLDNLQECPACEGTGVFNKRQDRYVIALGKEGFETLPFFSGGTFTNVQPVRKFKYIAGTPEKFLLPSDKV